MLSMVCGGTKCLTLCPEYNVPESPGPFGTRDVGRCTWYGVPCVPLSQVVGGVVDVLVIVLGALENQLCVLVD